ncbi:MAG: hypothetical protein EZS28_003941 [Streblomastix strix]|uniref:Proteinase inhibitor I42 chagasin domain-containing protein n=1 Tax=Streblomastix strix TaxID=222440 RepID=A0A5J4WZW1_9EUKA|nr:MAG: hypothetical protein EZS28_003941 [Streblomastix strix]
MLIIVLLVELCYSNKTPTAIEPTTMVSILNTKVNDTFDISLQSQLTTGYMWVFKTILDNEESIVKIINESFQQDNPQVGNYPVDVIGGTETYTVTFIARKKGTIDLKYIYRRVWLKEGEGYEEIRIFHVNVD